MSLKEQTYSNANVKETVLQSVKASIEKKPYEILDIHGLSSKEIELLRLAIIVFQNKEKQLKKELVIAAGTAPAFRLLRDDGNVQMWVTLSFYFFVVCAKLIHRFES